MISSDRPFAPSISDLYRSLQSLKDAVSPPFAITTEHESAVALQIASVVHCLWLCEAIVDLAKTSHHTGVSLISRAMIETVIIGKWLVKMPTEAVPALVGAHARHVRELAKHLPPNGTPPAVATADKLNIPLKSFSLEQVAHSVGLSDVYNQFYRGESTFSEHGVGPIEAHITATEPWAIVLRPEIPNRDPSSQIEASGESSLLGALTALRFCLILSLEVFERQDQIKLRLEQVQLSLGLFLVDGA
jgi:hypothetical protein